MEFYYPPAKAGGYSRNRNEVLPIIERPKILFDRLIAFYVQRGLPMPIDAGKFQQGLRERCIERDGMFFYQRAGAGIRPQKSRSAQFCATQPICGQRTGCHLLAA